MFYNEKKVKDGIQKRMSLLCVRIPYPLLCQETFIHQDIHLVSPLAERETKDTGKMMYISHSRKTTLGKWRIAYLTHTYYHSWPFLLRSCWHEIWSKTDVLSVSNTLRWWNFAFLFKKLWKGGTRKNCWTIERDNFSPFRMISLSFSLKGKNSQNEFEENSLGASSLCSVESPGTPPGTPFTYFRLSNNRWWDTWITTARKIRWLKEKIQQDATRSLFLECFNSRRTHTCTIVPFCTMYMYSHDMTKGAFVRQSEIITWSLIKRDQEEHH